MKNFINLANAFIGWFIANVLPQRKAKYLETIKYRKDEMLRDYVAKFNTEPLQILDLDSS